MTDTPTVPVPATTCAHPDCRFRASDGDHACPFHATRWYTAVLPARATDFALTVHAYRDRLLDTDLHRLCVSAYDAPHYLQGHCYLTRDDQSGFAVSRVGELESLFSRIRGRGPTLLRQAVRLGATHLHCYDGPLTRIYERAGFSVTDRYAFDPGLAPAGWDVRVHGTPCYLRMEVTL